LTHILLYWTLSEYEGKIQAAIGEAGFTKLEDAIKESTTELENLKK
jgi:hypothetical protein